MAAGALSQGRETVRWLEGWARVSFWFDSVDLDKSIEVIFGLYQPGPWPFAICTLMFTDLPPVLVKCLSLGCIRPITMCYLIHRSFVHTPPLDLVEAALGPDVARALFCPIYFFWNLASCTKKAILGSSCSPLTIIVCTPLFLFFLFWLIRMIFRITRKLILLE